MPNYTHIDDLPIDVKVYITRHIVMTIDLADISKNLHKRYGIRLYPGELTQYAVKIKKDPDYKKAYIEATNNKRKWL